MSFIEKTAFQPRVWNNRNNDLQTIPGLYATVSGSDRTPEDCSAGLLCTKGAHIAGGGYEMSPAADGKGDVYACHPSDVRRVDSDGNRYAVGAGTLGLGIPAGVMDSFTQCVPGEVYAFGPGNFSALMDADKPFATVANGLLAAAAEEPAAGTGIYFELDAGLGIDQFTEGAGAAFARYNLLCKRN